jgi:MerR family copper efflux transcriptional regulator
MRIGELAKTSNVSVDTLRYYEKIGLMKSVERTSSGYRIYDYDDVERLKFIKNAQQTGFSLEQIEHLLSFRASPVKAKPEIREVAKQKVTELSTHINELTKLRNELQELIKECEQDKGDCPIIKSFNEKS